MNELYLYETGKIAVLCDVLGVGQITALFYPLCGDAVQTEVFDGQSNINVRPDCYRKPVVSGGEMYV